jgi:hypothetical protein
LRLKRLKGLNRVVIFTRGTQRQFINLLFAALTLVAAGCNKSEPVAPPSESTTNSFSSATSDLKQKVEQVGTAIENTAEKISTDAKQSAQNMTATARAKLDIIKVEANRLIDKTKSSIDGKKYEEALNYLKELSNLSLTPEQQQTVDELKTQIQKLASSQVVTNAASAIGNLFKK